MLSLTLFLTGNKTILKLKLSNLARFGGDVAVGAMTVIITTAFKKRFGRIIGEKQ